MTSLKRHKTVSYTVNIENVTEDQIRDFESFMNAFINLGHFYNIDFSRNENDY